MWSRRAFIGAAAAVTAAPSAADRNIRWGLGAVTWTARAGGRQVRWREILPDIRAGGFDGFEPFTTANLPVNDENMADLERLAPEYGLRMSAIYWGDQFHLVDQRERLRKECHRFLGYLKRFQCDRLVFGPPGPNVEDEREAIKNMAAMVNEIGRIALTGYNVKTSVHPHVGGLIENPRQIDLLMRQTDPKYFNLAPDTAQLWMGGGEPVEMFEKYKNRLVYIHYKDICAYHRGLKGYMDNVIELGRGVIDFPALHRILRSVKYRGWITIDLDNARISPLESAKVQREYIDRVLAPIYA
ncbi:MAG: TIM barrel protein [Bryobacterales bacterium]|nr:TIM barrel protein [Bryobacterales bacterium]